MNPALSPGHSPRRPLTPMQTIQEEASSLLEGSSPLSDSMWDQLYQEMHPVLQAQPNPFVEPPMPRPQAQLRPLRPRTTSFQGVPHINLAPTDPASFVPDFINPLYSTPRDQMRHELASRPLVDSVPGRYVLGLATLCWYRLESGLYVAKLPEGAHAAVSGQIANIINWLGCGARAHRSFVAGVLGVRNLEHVNLRIINEGCTPIACLHGDPPWLSGNVRRIAFLRPGYRPRSSRWNDV